MKHRTPPGTRLMSELPPRERFAVQHWRGLGAASVLVLVLAMGIVIALLRIDNATSQVSGLQDSVRALTTAGAQNQARLQELGQTPVGPPVASISAGKATPTPTEGAPVSPHVSVTVQPSQGQVAAAVAAYFVKHPPKVPFSTSTVITRLVPYVTSYLKAHPAPSGKNGVSVTGSPGPSGPGPTDQQINVAVQAFLPATVADYLTENPPPSGPPGSPGANGTNGTNGMDGSVGPAGPQGPGPTEQQIADAVSAYFAEHPLACEDGYTATNETVTTTTGPVVVQVCVANNQPTTAVSTIPNPTTTGSTP